MEQTLNELKFDNNGLIPVIVQEYKTGEVLMMAYMNSESYGKTIETGLAHYWSRSRNKLWKKGETSGCIQKIKSICMDCDGDTLLIKVEQVEAACHTGHHSCFYREINHVVPHTKEDVVLHTKEDAVSDPEEMYGGKHKILKELYDVISDRTTNPIEGSYTNYLFEKGLDKILKKIGEESAEVIIAAKNKSKDEMIYEIADLYYHLFVLMVEEDVQLDDIYDELKKRSSKEKNLK